jgi:hypothetical protein
MNASWLYVAILYAGAIFVARRAGADIRPRIALLFYLLTLLFLWRPLTGPYINVEVDYYKTVPPWAYILRHQHVENPQMNDVFFQMTPWAHQVRESWRSLEVPLWNDLAGSGYPLLANAQSQALSPYRILALPLSLGHAMTAEAAMKILLATTFAFLFCRRRRYSEIAAAIGAVSCGFTLYIVVWLHFAHATTASFLPAIFYFVDAFAERVTLPRFAVAAVTWCFTLFGGHPETAAHIFFLALLYVLWHVLLDRKRALRFVGALCGALAVAALLAAPLLLPFFEALPRSLRYHTVRAENDVPHTGLPAARVLLQPHFFGQVPFEKSWGTAEAESMTGYSGILAVAGFFALLAHVVMTRSWRSHEFFFVCASFFVLGVIFQWPGISDLFHQLFPMAANARVRLLLGFLLAIQAAAAVDLAMRGRTLPLLIGSLTAALLLGAMFFTADFQIDYRRDTAVISLLSPMAVLLATLLLNSARTRAAGAVLLVAFVTADLFAAGRGWNPSISNRMLYPRTGMIRAAMDLRAKENHFRVAGYGAAVFPNLTAIYDLPDIRVHDPMANERYMRVLAAISPAYDPTNYFAQWFDLDTNLLDYLGVKYLLADPRFDLARHERWRSIYDGRDGTIFENRQVLPRFFTVRNVILQFDKRLFWERMKTHQDWAQTALLDNLRVENDQVARELLQPRPADAPEATSRVTFVSPTEYRLRVAAPRYTLVVSSVPFWPGWKIARNGEPLKPIRVNYAFLGFIVPAGESDVRVAYEPWTFRAGVAIAIATLVALLSLRIRRGGGRPSPARRPRS